MRHLLFASLSVSALVACGDDGGKATDARIVGMDAPVVCAAEAAYGAITKPLDPIASRDLDVNPEFVGYTGSLNMDIDDLSIELYKGYGVFETTEIVPTNVTLDGVEAAYDTCGACVLIYANYDADTGETEMTYLAVGGTLNITSVSPNITGTLLGASFVHVTIDADGVSQPAPDNCASSVASFPFDAMVVTDPPAFAPGGSHRHPRKRPRVH